MRHRQSRFGLAATAVVLVGSLATGLWSTTAARAAPEVGPAPGRPNPSAAGPTPRQTNPAAPSGKVTLLQQTPQVDPGQDWKVQVRVTGVSDPTGLELAITVYRPPDTREELAANFRGEGLSGGREAVVAPLGTAAPNADGTFTLVVPTQSRDGSRPGAFTLPSVSTNAAPIYPVQVELREVNEGPTAHRFTTQLLAVRPHDDGSGLRVAVVLPIHAPPQSSTRTGPATTPPIGSSSIEQLTTALLAQPAVPLVMAPTPETLDELGDADRPALERLAAAVGDRQVVAQPWVPFDAGTLGDAAQSELKEQVRVGGDAAAEALDGGPGAAPTARTGRLDRRTWLAEDPLDPTTLDAVLAAGIDRVVVKEQDLVRPPSRVQPLQPVTLTSQPARPVDALVADPGLASHFDPDLPADQQTLAAHRLLAELTFMDEDAAESGPRVTAVVAPRGWKAKPGFLSELLAGLAANPVLRPTDLDDGFAGVPRATTGRGAAVTRTLAPPGRVPIRTSFGKRLETVREQLAVRRSVLVSDDERAADLGQDVLTAESRDLTAADQESRLATVVAGTEEDLKGIRMPGSRAVSLTARTGEIPITVLNDTGKLAQVIVHLESDKLEFPEGARRLISLDKQATTQVFKVRARAPGAVPLRIHLETPAGQALTRLPTKFTVRQTALPRVGLILFGLAAIVLVAWWLRSARDARGGPAPPADRNRSRRAVPGEPSRLSRHGSGRPGAAAGADAAARSRPERL